MGTKVQEPPRLRNQYVQGECSPGTLMPRCAMRASRRRLSSGKGTAGRATSEVSSRNTRVALKGIAYRNVGSRLQGSGFPRALRFDGRWARDQRGLLQEHARRAEGHRVQERGQPPAGVRVSKGFRV